MLSPPPQDLPQPGVLPYLPIHIIELILRRCPTAHRAAQVSRSWTAALGTLQESITLFMAQRGGGVNRESVLQRACTHGCINVARALLDWSDARFRPRADCLGGQPYLMALAHDHAPVLLLLLEWPVHAPVQCAIDSCNAALMLAARTGHTRLASCVLGLLVDTTSYHYQRQLSLQSTLVCAAHHGHAPIAHAMMQRPHIYDCQDGMILCAAAQGGHSALLRMLCTYPGGPMNSHNARQALLVAADHGHVDIVLGLLEYTRDVRHGGSCDTHLCDALCRAAGAGHVEVVRALLSTGADDPWRTHDPPLDPPLDAEPAARALCRAAANGHTHVVLALLGAPEDARRPPRADCQNGSALCAAARGGHLGAVQALLGDSAHPARADCQDGSALCSAAAGGHLLVVHTLLQDTAHPLRADCQNGAALCLAAAGGHTAVVRALLASRHPPRADGQNFKALCRAVSGGHDDTASELLQSIQSLPRCSSSHHLHWCSRGVMGASLVTRDKVRRLLTQLTYV
jgi:ankyrin repeat protein